ncbi:hypothetical protein [Pontibacter sp. SGAir0037]|uniref:hypothetical protein n=1 Tax=Pontibacter sp. SGAir0037 TaxID=2571030 RepID=UPI0010CD4136|nr:hypothetical protein [Pontibacter sp. SGAir0037]QCR25297.1 hypothetical protein C1N53_22540 [Pontibacter sp. SGAir0037]
MQIEDKSPKFELGKRMLEKQQLTSLAELFDIVPYTPVAKALGVNNQRLRNKIDDPRSFRVSEVLDLAVMLDVDAIKLFALLQETIKKSAPAEGATK